MTLANPTVVSTEPRLKIVSELVASAVTVLGPFAYSMPAESIVVRELFIASIGFEFVISLQPLLNSNEYPLETAHFPVSLNAVVVT